VTIISNCKYLLYLNTLFKLNILQLNCWFLYRDTQALLVHEDVRLSAMFQAKGCTV
jgi:hypothetical protein